MYRAFEIFCLPWGILCELEWCVYQEPGFERAHWEEVLHSNYVPEDLAPHILRWMDELEQYNSHVDGMYRPTLILLLANILYGRLWSLSAFESMRSEQASANTLTD